MTRDILTQAIDRRGIFLDSFLAFLLAYSLAPGRELNNFIIP